MSEYIGICVSFPKSTWMASVLYFPTVIPCLLESVVTYFNVCTKRFSLKEIQAVFLKTQNLIFSIVAVSTLFAFLF